MGTRFAATAESLAPPAYKELLVSQQMADSITTDRISGMSATFLRGSIEGAGLDPDNLPPRAGLLKPTLDPSIQAWRDIWSRSEEHTSELHSLMRTSYAVFCLKKKKKTRQIK